MSRLSVERVRNQYIHMLDRYINNNHNSSLRYREEKCYVYRPSRSYTIDTVLYID
jgi:nicotinic acid mononucleotide adenylyltransferase